MVFEIMPEVKLECLYCGHKWIYISYYISKDLTSKCTRCHETKQIKAKLVSEDDQGSNVFGYDEPLKKSKENKEDDYRD